MSRLLFSEANAWREIADTLAADPTVFSLRNAVMVLDLNWRVTHGIALRMYDRLAAHKQDASVGRFAQLDPYFSPTDAGARVLAALFLALEAEDDS